ncbi:thiamine pyrophosphate-binding protein [Ramlibacter sp. RBP-2]|uniref:Thiamine pyrophosphate-binding protein n=1 Tax=Ramlibacter lithotrophicus TaxID=2606681 RepID=A0A7X6DJB4_9BURK|nr:thiamine pyrophosphate-binding protein [Ramlibacter lithotrophicus]NKE68221.1 thiamine pyrophosphate-binding protein [Ramlibacter lithotrophicus]
MATETLRGADAFVRLLQDEGVSHLFGNPGTTELGIMEAVGHSPGLRFVLGLQEAAVLGMADGYARASQRLVACNLHAAPGLGNAMGALYNAKFAGSPVLVTAGQHETGHGLQEPMLYEPLVRIAEPLVKWAVEVPRLQDLPRIVHRAAKVALTAPMGPVFLSLPGDIMDASAPLDLGRRTRVEHRVRPADEVLEQLAARLLAARRPVIIAGREVAAGDAFAELARLAELLGAGVFHEPVPYNARFDVEHPAFLGDLTRRQETARTLLKPFDLVVCVGADLLRMSVHSPVDPLPAGMPVVHLSNRDWELGKNHATELAIRADVPETLRALLPLLEARVTPGYAEGAALRLRDLSARNWRSKAAAARAKLRAHEPGSGIDPAFLMMTLAGVLPRQAIVVEEALTAAPALATFVPVHSPTGFYGLASGGLGFALPGAVGISLAHPGRPVVAAVGDGSAMYGVQALWSAAQQQLPITYVVIDNGGYRILQERLLARGRSTNLVGMELREPAIDWVAVAQGFGLAATRVGEPAALHGALGQAIASGRPALVQVMMAGAADR